MEGLEHTGPLAHRCRYRHTYPVDYYHRFRHVEEEPLCRVPKTAGSSGRQRELSLCDNKFTWPLTLERKAAGSLQAFGMERPSNSTRCTDSRMARCNWRTRCAGTWFGCGA